MKFEPKKTIELIRSQITYEVLPSVSYVAAGDSDPFKILVATMISLRTKDEVTGPASGRLFALADTPQKVASLSIDRIARLIYPAGFYKVKAKNIRKASAIIIEEFNGQVPADLESLLLLPGVGRKTANLVLGLGFGLAAICVDTHVHRVSNRLGWVKTDHPDATEQALMEILPQSCWVEINELLVLFGQQICKPLSPFCSRCELPDICPRINVAKHR